MSDDNMDLDRFAREGFKLLKKSLLLITPEAVVNDKLTIRRYHDETVIVVEDKDSEYNWKELKAVVEGR